MPIDRFNIDPILPALRRNATILVPNHRIRDAILSSYTNTLNEDVFVSPRVYAIDIWIRELWDLSAHCGIAPCAGLQLLTSSEEHFIWTAVIEQSLAQHPLLQPEETATAVNESYRSLRQWLPGNGIARMEHFLDAPDVRAFAHWIKAYQRQCEQHQVISLVDAIAQLLDPSAFQWTSFPFLPAEICLVNFFEPPLLYADLFASLASVATVQHFACAATELEPELARCSFADQESELAACANWAKALIQTAPGQHIGILYAADPLAQASLREQLLAALAPAETLAARDPDSLFNSSGSRQHLLDTGLIHDAFLILNLVNQQQSSQDLSRLLQSPFLIGADSEQEARLHMELQMRRRFTAQASLADFSWHLQQEARPTHAPLLAAALLAARTRLRQFPARATAREWVLHFSDWLTDFGWPGEALDATDLDTYQQWQEVLRSMAAASSILGSLTPGAALAKLKSLCLRQALTSRFHAASPLSIYSVTEAVGLHFDQVWLLGFSDQAWPPAARPSPFIPYLLQKEAQVPGSDSDLQLQRAGRQFALLKSAVRQRIIASHHRRAGELECSPSGFISAWPTAADSAATAVIASRQASHTTHHPATLETITDLPAFPLQAAEAVQGGASIITNQSNCPFRAFARHRLQVEPLERFTTGLSLRDRGSALHAALELLFTRITSRTALLALDTQARDTALAEAARHGVDYLCRRHRELMTPRFRALEQQRIQQLLQGFLALESSREEFRVVAREAAFDWEFDRLKLHVKIDRIDTLADASLALLDYKSGTRVASSQSWLDTRPEDMQLPLYYTVATAAQEAPVSALLIAHVNAEKLAYSGLVATSAVHATLKPVDSNARIASDWQDLAIHWEQTVRQRAAEFTDGAAQVAPLKGRKTCTYCGLQALCRIQELDSSMVEDEPEHGMDA